MDTKATMDTYANIVKNKNIIYYDYKNSTIKPVSRCIYDEICSRTKMCGDCAADEFESQRNEEAWENFKIDRKMELL